MSLSGKATIAEAEAYNKGWNDAMKEASKIALAIDSNRGNEKEISKAILNRKMEFKNVT